MSRFVSELDKQTKPNDEWVKAEREIEESRKKKADAGRQEDAKSLYEVLQANKGVFAPEHVSLEPSALMPVANHTTSAV